MIGTDSLDRVIGADVYDADGDRIGTASGVYLDDRSGAPEWVTVKTGLFGTKESFVPIRDADLTGDGLRVRVSKDAVKDAPTIDPDGHLSPDEEQELYRYYDIGGDIGRTTDVDEYTLAGTARTTTNTGMGAGVTDPTGDTTATTNPGYNEISGNDGTTGHGDTVGNRDTGVRAEGSALHTGVRRALPSRSTGHDDSDQHATHGPDTSGPTTDDAMTPSAERVDVSTERTGAGRGRLRKYVVTEDGTKARDALSRDDRR